MSRRTKFLITAIFLVLLAIPIGYVGLTWTTQHPLRIRYLGQDEPEIRHYFPFGPEEGTLMVPIRLEVENTTVVPIYVFEARWPSRRPPNPQEEDFIYFMYEREIPARAIIRDKTWVTPEQAQKMKGQELAISCEWTSATKQHAFQLIYNVAQRLRKVESVLHLSSRRIDERFPVEEVNTIPPASASPPLK